MGAIIKHTKNDIKRFRAEKCEKCHDLNACMSFFEDMDEHVQYCPKFFNFMIGYKSFIEEQSEWEREHPEEAEAQHQRNLEISRKIKSQRITKKKS